MTGKHEADEPIVVQVTPSQVEAVAEAVVEHASRKQIVDVAERVGITFVEGAAAYAIAVWPSTDWSDGKKAATTVIVGAVSAGLSAVYNLARGWISNRSKTEGKPPA